MVSQAMVKGWTGELKTKIAESLFLDLKEYHVFNNVLIHTGLWTSQIDHVIVSRYGIFVIETKNKNGWIFGKCYDKRWTQTFINKKSLFQNPLRQNFKHIKYLAGNLNIDHKKMYSVVVFWGHCQFQTPMPSNVMNSSYTSYVRNKKEVLLTDAEVEECCRKIQGLKDNTSFLDGSWHVSLLNKRFGHN